MPYLLCVAKKNELNLLMLYIRLVQSFVSCTITNEFTDAPYLAGMVVHVMYNNELSLLMLHIWLVRSLMSRTKNELSLLLLHLVGRVVRFTDNNANSFSDGPQKFTHDG